MSTTWGHLATVTIDSKNTACHLGTPEKEHLSHLKKDFFFVATFYSENGLIRQSPEKKILGHLKMKQWGWEREKGTEDAAKAQEDAHTFLPHPCDNGHIYQALR